MIDSKIKIGEKILEILATAGVVGFTALCEGARDSGWVKGRNSPESRVKRSLNGLARQDFVVKIKSSAGPKWELTPEGKKFYDQNNLDKIAISKPDVWDGKWRMIIFDIPEQIGRHSRDIFRRKLKEFGFQMVQESTFVCPWSCTQEIKELSELLGLDSCIQILEVNFLTGDEDLKNKFGL